MRFVVDNCPLKGDNSPAKVTFNSKRWCFLKKQVPFCFARIDFPMTYDSTLVHTLHAHTNTSLSRYAVIGHWSYAVISHCRSRSKQSIARGGYSTESKRNEKPILNRGNANQRNDTENTSARLGSARLSLEHRPSFWLLDNSVGALILKQFISTYSHCTSNLYIQVL
jgi:hypothetical protein